MLFNMYINSFSLLPTCVFPRISKYFSFSDIILKKVLLNLRPQ